MVTTTLPHKTSSARILPAEAQVVLDWIDRELVEEGGANSLLELRSEFSKGEMPRAIAAFYRLQPRLERRHFLLVYRVRRFLQCRFELVLSDPLERVERQCFILPPSGPNLCRRRCDFANAEGAKGITAADVRVRFLAKSNVGNEALAEC